MLAALAIGCAASPQAAPHPSARSTSRWLVIAPHPDDEVLIAAGVLKSAVERGDDVAIAVMTNGDYDCVHDGLAREAESVAGLAVLGVPESRVFFLGYPDGGLARLGDAPLSSRRRTGDGACALLTTTYGARGAGGADFHRVRAGTSATYTRANAVGDLATLLAELSPTDVAITHPDDTHADHAATYALFRAALERSARAPRVHRAMVHNDDCWPIGTQPHEPCPPPRPVPAQPMPSLTNRLAGYDPTERLPVPATCFGPDRSAACKLRAIAAHASQTRSSPESYLFGFARSDEAFFLETFDRGERGWRRSGARAREAAEYALDVDREARIAILKKSGVEMRRWPLPHDLFAAGKTPALEVTAAVHPDGGGAVDVELRVRGELVAAAVDVSASPSVRRAP